MQFSSFTSSVFPAKAAVAVAALAAFSLAALPAQAEDAATTNVFSASDTWAATGAAWNDLPASTDLSAGTDLSVATDGASADGTAPGTDVFRSAGGVSAVSSVAALSLIAGLFYLFNDHGSHFTPGAGTFTSAPGASRIVQPAAGAPVPETSTTVSLGLLLTLGGLVIAVRRKKALSA